MRPDADDAALKALCTSVDRARAGYLRSRFGVDWMDLRHYDLSIDTGRLGLARVHRPHRHGGRTVVSLSRGLSAMGVRNYRLFWSGQLVSLVGTWMDSVAQSWLILLLTNDPVALGLRAVFQFVPVMVLGLFGGIIADTLPKRATLYVTQAGSGLVALTLGVLTLTGTVQVWHIYVLAAILGSSARWTCRSASHSSSRWSAGSTSVNAVALNSATFNGARIIGPAVGGVLIGGGRRGPLLHAQRGELPGRAGGPVPDARGRAAPSGSRSPVAASVRAVVDQLAEGLRYVQRTPIGLPGHRRCSASSARWPSTSPSSCRCTPPETMHGDASTYGYLMAAAGAGSLVGRPAHRLRHAADLAPAGRAAAALIGDRPGRRWRSPR